MGIFEENYEKATALQQNFYELSSDWNVYKKEEKKYLYNYIGYALYGPPTGPDDENSIDSIEDAGSLFIYKEHEAEQIDNICKKIIEFGIPKKKSLKIMDQSNEVSSNEEFNEDIYCVALYNIIFADKQMIIKFESDKQKAKEKKNLKLLKMSKKPGRKLNKEEKLPDEHPLETTIRNVIPVVIFKFKVVLENMTECCWFIDANGRIYKQWDDYIENNKLLECTMVLPKDGEYQPNPSIEYNETETSVFLECHQSPACNRNIIVSGLDGVNFVGSLGALVVTGISVFTPLAPIVITGAVVAGVASGAWGIGRSSNNLKDRYTHEESLASKEAVADWLSIGSSAIGILSVGATKVLSKAIERGAEISKTGRFIHDAISGSSILVTGGSAIYRSYGIYTEKSGITKTDVFFLVLEIFFLCNGVMNMQTAKNIIETEQTRLVEDFKKSLRSNRHRKAFNKITKGADSSTDIIRGINKIDRKHDFFAAFVKNQKSINRNEFSKLSIKERVNLVTNFMSADSAISSSGNACKSFFQTFNLKTPGTILSNVKSQQFVSVYNDIKTFFNENRDLIMREVLNLARLLYNHLCENDTTGEIMASLVDFLWNKIKAAISNMPMNNVDQNYRRIIQSCILPLHNKIDVLVEEWEESLRRVFTSRLMA